MKKQIFSLMLSTAVFTTSPLFAMDLPEGPRVTHIKLAQSPETDEGRAGRGSFSQIDDPVIQGVIEKAEDEKTMVNLSCTSHAMNFLCQLPIYKTYAKNYFLPLGSLVELQGHVHNFFNLFSDSQQTYKVSVAQLQLFKKKPYADPSNPCSWGFLLKGKHLQMVNKQVGPDHLEDLDPDAMVTFSWSPKQGPWDVDKFWASVPVCVNSKGIKDLSTPEYQAITNAAFVTPDAYYCSNSFNIIKVDPK
jgi:hypothetical protein